MKAEVRYPFFEEIKKRSIKALIGIIVISWVAGAFFGNTLWFFSIFIKILVAFGMVFPFDLISVTFLTITGLLLIILEITRYKKFKVLDRIPLPILINAFISGTTLPMLFARVTTENVRIFLSFIGILNLFLLWNFGKALLDGLIEMKKIKLDLKIQKIELFVHHNSTLSKVCYMHDLKFYLWNGIFGIFQIM